MFLDSVGFSIMIDLYVPSMYGTSLLRGLSLSSVVNLITEESANMCETRLHAVYEEIILKNNKKFSSDGSVNTFPPNYVGPVHSN